MYDLTVLITIIIKNYYYIVNTNTMQTHELLANNYIEAMCDSLSVSLPELRCC